MATFIWVGMAGATTDSYGGTGASGSTGGTTGDASWISENNYWNRTSNWRERVAGGQTGNTGGGATGSPGAWYYQAATRIPSGSDKVILEGLANSPADGISDGPWPKSELLYGGISGGSWVGASGGATGTVDIEIKKSYYDSSVDEYQVYNRLRFGSNLTDNPIDTFNGLNLLVDELTSNSANDNNHWSTQTRFTLQGQDTTITTLLVNGVGIYSVRTASIDNLILEGEAQDTGEDNWIGKSLNYTHYGNISELCKVVCGSLDKFTYIPTYNSTAQTTQCTIAPKKMPNEKGIVDIRGAIGTLDIYPYYHYEGYTGDAKISVSSYNTANTYGTIETHGYNAYHSISYNATFGNLEVSFNNAGSTDIINNLLVNYGHFETDDLNAKLSILDGRLQVKGILDFRDRKPGGSIEVAGMSGGIAGEGIFNASINSTLLLPDGVNFAFNIPSGGETAAMNTGLGVSFRGGKG